MEERIPNTSFPAQRMLWRSMGARAGLVVGQSASRVLAHSGKIGNDRETLKNNKKSLKSIKQLLYGSWEALDRRKMMADG